MTRNMRPPSIGSLAAASILVALIQYHALSSDVIVTVTANPLWTDTGLKLSPAETLIVHDAVGSWNWGGGYSFGPDGDFQPGLMYDEWVQNGQHGELIGFVGENPYLTLPGDAGLFGVGTSRVTLAGRSGELWLGFNDDRSSGVIGDNSGLVNVTATLTSASQSLGAVLPDPTRPRNSEDNSRTLINGTCWKFIAQRSDGQPATNVKWTLEGANGTQLLNGDVWSDEVVSAGNEVWLKAGTADCKVHAEQLDEIGASLGTFSSTTVHVKFVHDYKQYDTAWGNKRVGFYWKDIDHAAYQNGTLLSFPIKPPERFGAVGCLVTCYAMISDYYAPFGSLGYTPATLNEQFRAMRYSGGNLGYYYGQYRQTLVHDVADGGDPPENATDWVFDKSTVPGYLDVNGDRLLTDEDAGANPVFNGDSLCQASGWPMYIASQQTAAYRTTIVPAGPGGTVPLAAAIPSLTAEPPVPVLVAVRGTTPHFSHHWVLGTGLSQPLGDGTQDIVISDPGTSNPASPCLFGANKNGYSCIALVIPATGQVATPSLSVTIKLRCKAQAYVQDSSGRRAGVLPSGEFVDEIGSTAYETQDDDGVPMEYGTEVFTSGRPKSLTLRLSETASSYNIIVTGTGPSPYFLDMSLTDNSGSVINQVLEGGLVDLGVEWDYTCMLDPIRSRIVGQLVPPTLSSMSSDLAGYLRTGAIPNAGVAISLDAKLSAAVAAQARSQTTAAAGVLNALILEVQALEGTQISIPAANNLISHARYIMNQLLSHGG